jgi:5-methylcytosine-specific restriction endonuclease McrA
VQAVQQQVQMHTRFAEWMLILTANSLHNPPDNHKARFLEGSSLSTWALGIGRGEPGCLRQHRVPSLGSQSNLPITSELTTAGVLATHTESFMNSRTTQPRFRLDRVSYRELRWQVLRRDGWRCQICGRGENLDVHHSKQRSGLGQNSESNLITLCRECHQILHSRRNGPYAGRS